ncbi:MAG: hypothetical protein H6R15_960 [Proteobacteria bacterium]|nr:hypothetical protein [Pseudomonadota bacterium]
MANETKTGTKARTNSPRPGARAGGIVTAGGSRRSLVGGASGSSLQGLGADVSGQLETLAPTFGNILSSIGLGVADSQAALDNGVIDTVRQLSDTKITVVTEVIEHLNDDGIPVADDTELITNELSVLNFVTPTVHEWKHVALSMDLSVGAMDDETGVSYSIDRSSTSMGSVGLFFGFIGVGYMSTSEDYRSMMASSHREAQWSNGVVQLDAVLAPRRTGKFPVPASVSIGPQIFVSQGSVVETKVGNVVTERNIEVLINVRKASGAVNPNKVLELDAGGLLPSFVTTAPFTGSTTNADGQVKVTLKRNITLGFAQAVKRSITLKLGQISKRFDLVI